ncbi:MAG: hypothetical protein M1115_09185 [Actinobacteria bacterium]|nr:hypothetical protein [Actinomycetota bacterium]
MGEEIAVGLLDKVKAQAEQVAAKAQQGVAQGQAKLDQMQTKRQGDALLARLGSALYAKERRGGPQKAVDDALAALDGFVAANPDAAAMLQRPLDSGDHTEQEKTVADPLANRENPTGESS